MAKTIFTGKNKPPMEMEGYFTPLTICEKRKF
jgi:hypothetical protein